MKKHFSKLFSLALVCMLVSALAIPASAVEIQNNGRMFGMKVTRINDMHTTINSPGKLFVDYELPANATVYVTGSLKHSITSGNNIKAGACYWNGSTYVAGPAGTASSGKAISGQMTVEDLADGKTYYCYAKNNTVPLSGYVYSDTPDVETVVLWCY